MFIMNAWINGIILYECLLNNVTGVGFSLRSVKHGMQIFGDRSDEWLIMSRLVRYAKIDSQNLKVINNELILSKADPVTLDIRG